MRIIDLRWLDERWEIFSAGDELRSWFAGQTDMTPSRLTIGALSPLSKNLQFEIIRPFIQESRVQVRVVEGEYADLLDRLRRHKIDLILSNLPLGGTDAEGIEARLLGEMPMYLVGVPPFKIPRKPFPEWLEGIPIFLPSSRTASRVGFDALMIETGFQPQIAAEVDDMALLRLLALSGAGLALVPEIGVKFELEEEKLLRVERVPGLNVRFYAITMPRRRSSPLIDEVIANGTELLARIQQKKPATL
ncbi:MAG: LysR family transcriptional regulator substrate-binding protein [Verrucomicrobiales bacterium]|nr:LysR family transcriptional regulator substrate-binding protein [Verrucomicrobiales bacterium]